MSVLNPSAQYPNFDGRYIALLGAWQPNIAYAKNSLVIQAGGAYLAIAAVPSRATFTAADWIILGGSNSSTKTTYFRGVNSSGAEFASAAATLPGTYNTDYSYDSQSSINYFAAQGHKIIRVPFRWERIQPTRNTALNTTELSRLTTIVSYIQQAGMRAILDVHNYARFINSTANGGAELALGTDFAAADIADLWTRLSTAFKGNAGIYAYGLMNEPHDLAANPGTFAGTVRYDWNDGTVQGWTGDSATATNVSNKLHLTATPSGTGFFFFRKDDAGTNRNSSATGNFLQATITLAAGITDSYAAKLQWQNSSYQWQTTSAVTYVRTDTGATTTGLIAGVPVTVSADFTSNPILANQPFAIQIETNNASSTSAVAVDVDNFSQGVVTGAKTPAQVWEAASQSILSAIRANSDTTLVMVPGYNFSGAQNWSTTHPSGWITDSASNFMYEAHYYFDTGNSGTYANTYATENTTATNNGYASLSARAVTEINVFLTWLSANSVKGYIGEFGWPNTGDTTNWNAVGAAVYNALDNAKVSATYWSAGERWGSTYLLSAYTGSPQATKASPASVIEAHQSGS